MQNQPTAGLTPAWSGMSIRAACAHSRSTARTTRPPCGRLTSSPRKIRSSAPSCSPWRSNHAQDSSWKSTDGGISGTMSAALKDGQTFSGPYLQVTSTTRSQDFDPLWTGWEYGWGGWGGFGPFPGTDLTTHY